MLDVQHVQSSMFESSMCSVQPELQGSIMKSIARQIVEGALGKEQAADVHAAIRSMKFHTQHMYVDIHDLVIMPCCSSPAVLNGYFDKYKKEYFFIKILDPPKSEADNIWKVLSYCILQPEKVRLIARETMGCVALYQGGEAV